MSSSLPADFHICATPCVCINMYNYHNRHMMLTESICLLVWLDAFPIGAGAHLEQDGG